MTIYDDDPRFVEALADPEAANFLPRRRFLYSKEDAEYDCYYWFLRGRGAEVMSREGITLAEFYQRHGKQTEAA